jgi:F-type H+-transporting ATPase subunit delta
MVDLYHGIQTAEVTTAVPLGEEDKGRLADNLSSLVGSKVVLKEKVDPKILGGIVARVGGRLLDGSTLTRLESLKRELEGR